MVDVTVERVIEAPVEQISAYAANPDNAPAWYVNIKSAKRLTEGEWGLGAQVAFTAQFMGRKLEYTYEVVEWEPRHKLVMRTADGPFPMETTYTWEAIDAGKTRMTLRNAGKPSGFSSLMAPFMARMMRKATTRDLALLKKILEGREVK